MPTTHSKRTVRDWARGKVLAWALIVSLPGNAASAADPVVLDTHHVDLRVRYRPESSPVLDLVVTDEDARPPVDHASTDCVLRVAEVGRLELPGDLPPLGVGGDPIWVLPSSQKDGLLYLGISGEGNPLGVFDGPLRLRLLDVRGPGHFFLWQAELGGLRFWMNSRDGIGDDDAYVVTVGGHSHVDWGFTTSGVYRLTFEAEGRRSGEATNVVSGPLEFTFQVLPLPAVEDTPFGRWRERHWPGLDDPAVVGVGADPDGDGTVNLWEYATGRSPVVADVAPASRVVLVRVGGTGSLALHVSRAKAATDVRFRVFSATAPTGSWKPEGFVSEWLVGDGDTDTWVVRIPDFGSSALMFYRVEASLEGQE